MSVAGGRFRVAFVCTGNRFRSPLGAATLRTLVPNLPVQIEEPRPMQREIARRVHDLTARMAELLFGAARP